MSKIVENVISNNDEGYNNYGTVVVSVRDTETGEVQTASANYTPSKSKAEAVKDASDKF